MPRALPGIVKVVLAIAVVVPAPLASAQFLARFRGQQTPAQKGRYEVNTILADEYQRLAEMKVELALLGDIATFPYEFAARANGNSFDLRGNVPNEMVRQRAMELARSSTYLRGIDALRIQPNLSVRSSLRPPPLVQQEGIELLQKECGASAKQMSLEARPNGEVVLTGRTDCVESKVEISRLFRRLPGCTAVINQLTIEPVVLDGQRMVRLTHNNLLLVTPSVVGQELEPPPASSPPRLPEKETPLPVERKLAVPAPAPLRTSNLNAREDELRLPAAVAQKQSSTATKPAAEKVDDDCQALAPSKLPVKWGHPSESWEAQAKDLEASSSLPSSTPRQQTPTPQTSPKPAKLVWTPQSAPPQGELPTPIRMVGQPSETKKTQTSAAASKSSRPSPISRPNFVETQTDSGSAMTWRRPGGSEQSEPSASVSGPSGPLADALGPEKLPPTASTSLHSSRRWPPAYVSGTPPSQGHPGVIAFDEEPPLPKPAHTVIATSRSLVPAELQRQIKSLCGRQARAVVAAAQKDGSVLVRVKVANRSIEDQLSRKILALPEMSSPRVRLMMEIEP